MLRIEHTRENRLLEDAHKDRLEDVHEDCAEDIHEDSVGDIRRDRVEVPYEDRPMDPEDTSSSVMRRHEAKVNEESSPESDSRGSRVLRTIGNFIIPGDTTQTASSTTREAPKAIGNATGVLNDTEQEFEDAASAATHLKTDTDTGAYRKTPTSRAARVAVRGGGRSTPATAIRCPTTHQEDEDGGAGFSMSRAFCIRRSHGVDDSNEVPVVLDDMCGTRKTLFREGDDDSDSDDVTSEELDRILSVPQTPLNVSDDERDAVITTTKRTKRTRVRAHAYGPRKTLFREGDDDSDDVSFEELQRILSVPQTPLDVSDDEIDAVITTTKRAIRKDNTRVRAQAYGSVTLPRRSKSVMFQTPTKDEERYKFETPCHTVAHELSFVSSARQDFPTKATAKTTMNGDDDSDDDVRPPPKFKANFGRKVTMPFVTEHAGETPANFGIGRHTAARRVANDRRGRTATTRKPVWRHSDVQQRKATPIMVSGPRFMTENAGRTPAKVKPIRHVKFE